MLLDALYADPRYRNRREYLPGCPGWYIVARWNSVASATGETSEAGESGEEGREREGLVLMMREGTGETAVLSEEEMEGMRGG